MKTSAVAAIAATEPGEAIAKSDTKDNKRDQR